MDTDTDTDTDSGTDPDPGTDMGRTAGGESRPVLGDSSLQSQTLEDVSAAVNYRRWLVSLAVPYLGEHALEVGSGHGDYAADWAAAGHRITASDADPHRLALLRERFAGAERVDVRELVLPSAEDGGYSAVVAYNVLEHIPDDVAALAGFRRLLRPDGAVVLFVPAFPVAMSRFDRAVGHQRRYRLDTLLAALAAAGLRTERLHYVNSLGLLAWIAGMRLLGMTPQDGPVLRAWDGAVVPVLRRLEARRQPPFGQSVFAVARA